MNILLTRPDSFNKRLVKKLPNTFHMISFPCLSIIKPSQQKSFEQVQKKLSTATSVIFTSPTAVQWAQQTYPELNLRQQRCYTIGKGSAEAAMRAFKVQAKFPRQTNSDGLIQLLQAESLQIEPVLIFTGEAGNSSLQDYFTANNINVDVIYTHRRKCPSYAAIDWSVESIDVTVCCSAQTLTCFHQLIIDCELKALLERPLIVVTAAMREQALAYDFKSVIIIANGASDKAIIQAIRQL